MVWQGNLPIFKCFQLQVIRKPRFMRVEKKGPKAPFYRITTPTITGKQGNWPGIPRGWPGQ